MQWLRSGLHSITDWLVAAPGPIAAADADVEAIRDAMTSALGTSGAQRKPRLAVRIRTCPHVDGLWELRGELMDIACQLNGESEGRRMLASVTALFVGLVPAASAARVLRGRIARRLWMH